MMTAPGAGHALPFWVPARFLLTGAVALAAFWTALALIPELALAHPAHPRVLALVHTLTLGFGALILVGAMHQLVPVLLVTRLHAPSWGTPTYLLLTAGSCAVIAGFAFGYRVPWLAAGGCAVWLGTALFASNLAVTAARAKRVDAAGWAVLLAAGHLLLTVTLGLLVALGRLDGGLGAALAGALPLHVGLGLVGTFLLAIAGAGHKLLGMFTLAHGVASRALRVLMGLVLLGTFLLALAAWAPDAWWSGPLLERAGASGLLRAAALAYLAAGACLAWDVRAILRARLRRRVDVGVTTFLMGLLALLPAALLLAAGRTPDAVALVLVGALPLAVAGMLVKIASFLAWQHRYAGRIGRAGGAGVPLLADMVVPSAGWFTLAALALSAAATTAGRALDAPALAASGAWLGAVGSWSLVAHLAWIVFGRHRPRAKPAGAGAGSAAGEVAHAG